VCLLSPSSRRVIKPNGFPLAKDLSAFSRCDFFSPPIGKKVGLSPLFLMDDSATRLFCHPRGPPLF